jgi:ABC-type Fe3+/spermidine/putrescine transport system ATPase subunit
LSDVRIERLSHRYESLVAVDDVSLDIASGEFVSLLGPSGSGKTTILRSLGGYVKPTSGRILIGGRDITALPPQRRDIGTVFQHYALFPHMRVFDNVAYGLRARGVAADEIRKRVPEALELVHLSGLERRYPSELSGGQQQRVALARAIVIRPSLLLMDEPLGALDVSLRESLQVEIRRIQRALGTTTVYVTHDQSEAFSMSDRIAVLSDGRIVELGGAEELYYRPAVRFTATFIGASNLFEVDEVVSWEGTRGTVRIKGQPDAFGATGRPPSGGDRAFVCLQPDRMVVSATPRRPSIGGQVVTRRFSGGGVVLTVEADGLTVKALDPGTGFQVGDRVYLSWEPEAGHLIVEPRP